MTVIPNGFNKIKDGFNQIKTTFHFHSVSLLEMYRGLYLNYVKGQLLDKHLVIYKCKSTVIQQA